MFSSLSLPYSSTAKADLSRLASLTAVGAIPLFFGMFISNASQLRLDSIAERKREEVCIGSLVSMICKC